MTMLQTQLTIPITATQYKSGSFQAAWDENDSRARRIPETIRQKNPAQTHLWCCCFPAIWNRATAKHNPHRVGIMTFPSQLVRCRNPFSKDIGLPSYIISTSSFQTAD